MLRTVLTHSLNTQHSLYNSYIISKLADTLCALKRTTMYKLRIKYPTYASIPSQNTRTAALVLELWTNHKIDSYQMDCDKIVFESSGSRAFAALKLQYNGFEYLD
jgi:hypothetical protein